MYKDSEKLIERKLVEGIKRLGGHALKFSSSTETGYPDRLVLLPGGKTIWVELKSTGCKPRLIQKLRHDELRKLGYQVEVIDSIVQLNSFLLTLK